MKVILIITALIVIAVLFKEQWKKHKIKGPSYKATESYHLQWLGVSLLWFIASVLFGLSYLSSTIDVLDPETLQRDIALFYFFIALVYVNRGITKDIICHECLWTSRGRIMWCDVRSCRIMTDDDDEFIYVELIIKGKTVLMKFLEAEREGIEALIKEAWC